MFRSLAGRVSSAPKYAPRLVVDTSRIRRELGYQEHVPLDEVLRHTVAWDREDAPEQIDPAQFDHEAEDAVLEALKDNA